MTHGCFLRTSKMSTKRAKHSKRLTSSQFDDILATQVRAGDIGEQYKHAMQDFQARQALQAGSMARNYQIQYGEMVENINRLPIALRGPTMERMKELGNRLNLLKSLYPMNFPRGPMPGQNEELARRRLIT